MVRIMAQLPDWQFAQVNSSNLDRVGYDSESKKMQVVFKKGTIYEYDDVTQAEYYGLLEAKSPGQYLSDHIKGVKPYRRIM